MAKGIKYFCCILVFCFLVSPVFYQLRAAEDAGGGTVGPLGDNAPQQETISATGSSPRISFDVRTYNAGEVWEGDVVSHDFIVKNTGASELTINKVEPG